MTDFCTFRSVLDLWPSKEAAAAAIGASSWTVSKWWQRDNIPAEWWVSLLATEVAMKNGITADLLTSLAAREVLEARA